MALSQARTLFGIHQVTLYQRGSNIPYGTLRVLKGSSLTITGEVVSLTGGSSRYIWDAQDGNQTAELSLKPAEIPNFLFNVLLGKSPTEVLTDPGNTSALLNVLNESVVDDTTGIDSVGVKTGSESDLKFGKYTVVAVSPTTVNVYAMTNVDFQRGTDKAYVDDLLKINDTPLTITTAGAVTEIPGFGVELTGGSGAIAMTEGDTATFDINPPSLEQMNVKIGEFGACIPEFGAVITAQKQGDGSMWEFDCFRVKAQGFPFGMEEKAYNEAEITGMLIYDSVQDGVFEARYLKPVSGC